MPLCPVLIALLICPTFRSNKSGAAVDKSPISGTCPVWPTRSLLLMVAPSFLGSLGQIVFRVRLVRQFVGLARQQLGQLLLPEIVHQMRLVFLKRGGVRRLRVFHLEDGETFAG